MYKRRDWLLFHGQDGEGSSSDEDSENEEEDEEDLDEEEGSDGSEGQDEDGDGSADGSEDDGADEGQMRRLEDLSEDDFEVGDSEDELSENEEEERLIRRALGIQLQSWLDEDGKAEQPDEVQPLRCILCPKSLLLNPQSLRSHLASEKHKKRAKKATSEGDEEDPLSYLRFAARVRTEAEATETHAERLQRVRKLKKGDGQPKRARKGKKLGKRQREALKNGTKEPSSKDGAAPAGDKAPEKKKKKGSSDEPDAPAAKEKAGKGKAAKETSKPVPEAAVYKVALPNKRRGGKKDKAVPIGVKPKISKGGQKGGRKGGPARSGGGRGRGGAAGGKARKARS